MGLVAPEIKYGDGGIDNFIKGFSLLSQMSAKREANELAVRKMVQDQANREREFGLKSQEQDLRAQRNADLADTANARVGVLQDTLAYQKMKDQETIQDQAGLVKALAGITAKEGTAEYKAQALEAMSNYPRAVGAKGHSNQLKVQQTLFNEELKQLGIPYDALENPNIWQQDPQKPGKSFLALPDNSTGLTKFVTVDDSKRDRLQSRYKDLFGDPESGRPMPRSPLTPDIAKKFLEQAGGDKARARELATEAGYSF